MKLLGAAVAAILITVAVLLVEQAGPVAESQAGQPQRAYEAAELQRGQDLFREHCAVCHGRNAEGTVERWHERDANGKLPPPPLNGTAHAWHHSVQVLHRTIRDGTEHLGGSMPPWKDKLSDEEILLIIQWLTSLWPDEIYQGWLKQTQPAQ